MRVHLAIPYRILLERLPEVLSRRICPEIYFDAEALDGYSERDLLDCARALRREGLSYSVHAPFMDLAPGAPDPKVRGVVKERFWATLTVAELIRPDCVVFHPGYDRWHYAGFKDRWLEISLEVWGPLIDEARRRGIRLAIENVFDEDPSLIRELLKETGWWAGFCFDPAHHLLYSEAPVAEWFRQLGRSLLEVHLHDNHGKSDEHLPPGEGKVNFEEVFRHLPLRDDLLFTLEVHKEEYVARGLKAVRELLELWRTRWSS